MTSGSIVRSSSRSNETKNGARAAGELAQTRFEVVEPGRDDGLHGGRKGPARCGRTAVGVGEEHAGRLDDEEGIAAGALGDLDRLGVLDPPARGLSREIDRLVGGERVELEPDGVRGRRSPGGPLFEQRRAGQREDQDPAMAFSGGRAEAFDQLEHRRAELVRVLEHEDGGRVAREAVDERDEPRLHVLHERRLCLPVGHAEQEREPFDEVLGVARLGVAIGQLVEAALRLLVRVVLLQAGELGDDRRGGRERRRVGEGSGAAHEHRDVVLHDRDELVGQARLADARFAEDAHEHRVPGAGRAVQALAQDRELARAPDERDRPSGRTRREGLHGEAGDRVAVEALRGGLAFVAVRDRVGRERDGGLAGEHLAGCGGGLEAGGGVHDGTGDEELPGRAETGGGLARLDADVDVERRGETERLAEPSGPGADRETGADGAERVVLVHGRQSEHGHHGVADELLRPAAEREELLGRGLEEEAEDLAGAFGVQALRQTGGVDEVGEQHRDHLAFLGAERGAHGRAAVGAEARALRERFAADRAGGHGFQDRCRGRRARVTLPGGEIGFAIAWLRETMPSWPPTR